MKHIWLVSNIGLGLDLLNMAVSEKPNHRQILFNTFQLLILLLKDYGSKLTKANFFVR